MKSCQNGCCQNQAIGNYFLFLGGLATRTAWLCRPCLTWFEEHGMDWRTDRRATPRAA
jgi:hypothetical protein